MFSLQLGYIKLNLVDSELFLPYTLKHTMDSYDLYSWIN